MSSTFLMAALVVIAIVVVIPPLLFFITYLTQGTNKLLLLATIFSWLLFILLMVLSTFTYLFHQMLIVVVCTFVIIWLTRKLQSTQHPRTKAILRALIVLVIFTGAFNASARFNFLLTAWARQRVVEKEIRHHAEQKTSASYLSIPELLILKRPITQIDGDSVTVYFDHYNRSPTQAGYIIYTNNLGSIRLHSGRRLTKLKRNWYFLVRDYGN